MERPFKQIEVERVEGAFCVRIRKVELDEKSLEDVGAEIARLIDEENGLHIILNLGPKDPLCLYSVLLAKLISLQRRLQKIGGELALANLGPETKKIFQVAGLEKFFSFYPDQTAALEALRSRKG
ncbi:MAG: STAS domain-containing protein [Planctomycetes bacterium]|nr:STAS domain-containing protein [Planctomycetota bacterium]